MEEETSKEKLSTSKEVKSDPGFDRVFDRYGSNLAAFFRDAYEELALKRNQQIAKRASRHVEPHTS
jgi:hypothetical protein